MKSMFYGKVKLRDFLPEDCNSVEIEPKIYQPEFDNLETELGKVLDNPLGFGGSLEDIIRRNPNSRTIILVDDHTRPNKHTPKVLPLLLYRLREYGAKNVNILFATGSHRDPTTEEQRGILSDEVYESHKDRLLIHNYRSNCVDIGNTSTGVPIRLNKNVVDADNVIPLTDSELHYFAGVAGTRKSICPGVSHEETIKKTHAKMFDPDYGFKPECRLGNVENNPVSMEFNEIARRLSEKVNLFGVDVLMCGDEPVHIAAGDVLELHKQAVPKIVEMRSVKVDSEADVTVVDPGILGQNLYQAGKGFNCGWYSAKKDGTGKIIVLAPCNDGVGNDAYEQMMTEIYGMDIKDALSHILEKYCNEKEFKIGYQKPVDLLRILISVGENNLLLLTEMKKDYVEKLRLQPIPRIDDPETDLKRYLEGTIEEGMNVDLIYDPGVLVKVK